MAIEAGGKNGIFPVDEKTIEYLKEHSKRDFKVYEADPDAEYDEEYTIDLSELKPTVSFPHLPENTRTIDEVGDIAIDQVVIGSCTNGRIEDMRIAAEILRQKSEKRSALHRDSGDTGDLFTVPERGTFRDLHRGWCRCQHSDLRSVPGRLYGYPGRKARDVYPRPTVTSLDVWDTWILRFIWQARQWQQPAPLPEK